MGDLFPVTPCGSTGDSQIVPAVAFDPDSQRWLLVWSTNPHSAPRRVYGRFVSLGSLTPTVSISISISISVPISIATTYHDAFAPSAKYNPATGEFLVAFTVNGEVGGARHSWELFHQRVLADGTLPGGLEVVPLGKHGTHNWTDANSLEVAESGDYLLSYASVRDGGGFFGGPYDVRQFRLDSQGSQSSEGLVSDFSPYATDTEYDISIGISNTMSAVWGDLRDGIPHIWGRRYNVSDPLPSPRATKYYYYGGQRVAMRTVGGPRPELVEGVYYLHGDHLGSTSLATYGSGPQIGQAVPNSRVWYYPYGEVRYGGSGLPTDFTFTSQRNDASTGLMYYKARYYHPRLGRFVSADTIIPGFANPQSLNRYSYVNNNPLKYIDPTGRREIECNPGDPGCDSFGRWQKQSTLLRRFIIGETDDTRKIQPPARDEGYICSPAALFILLLYYGVESNLNNVLARANNPSDVTLKDGALDPVAMNGGTSCPNNRVCTSLKVIEHVAREYAKENGLNVDAGEYWTKERIMQFVAKGIPVMVNYDGGPGGGYGHSVVIYGYDLDVGEGGTFYTQDPLFGGPGYFEWNKWEIRWEESDYWDPLREKPGGGYEVYNNWALAIFP